MPGATFTADEKQQAIALLKEMDREPLSGLTIAEISRRTGIGPNNLTRWRDEKPNKKAKKKAAPAPKATPESYQTRYELERLRNKYLTRAIGVGKEDLKVLEIEYLRERSKILGFEAEPLFSSSPRKRGRPSKAG